MTAPRHPQLMAPADDPQEFIEASIYWYPLLFPTRTEVLDHTFLCNGNGYEWGEDGKIHSVFAHIRPDYGRLEHYLRDADAAQARGRFEDAEYERGRYVELLAVRDGYKHRARTYGPVRATEQVPGEGNGRIRQARTIGSEHIRQWTLLGRAPENTDPAWAAVLREVRDLFAPVMVEQGTLW